MDTPLEMTADGIHIVISPRRTEEEDLLNASLNRINDRFGVTFSRFGEKKTALCVLMQSVSQGIYRHEWPQQESLLDDHYGQLQPLREPPICYPEVGSQDSEDRRRHRLGGRRPLDHLRNMGRADRPGIRKERELKRRRNENGLRVVRRTVRGAANSIESQHNMGLRTELSFCHGSCVRKNRADPCAALRLRAGESSQGRRYLDGPWKCRESHLQSHVPKREDLHWQGSIRFNQLLRQRPKPVYRSGLHP